MMMKKIRLAFVLRLKRASFVSFNDDCSQGTVTGTIDIDYTFIEDVDYILGGVVKVGDGNVEITNQTQYESILSNGVTLTVEPSVEVKGAADGVLLVTRGSSFWQMLMLTILLPLVVWMTIMMVLVSGVVWLFRFCPSVWPRWNGSLFC